MNLYGLKNAVWCGSRATLQKLSEEAEKELLKPKEPGC